MFGWEFPPNNSGGLGTACFGLTKGLAEQGVEVLFVVPTSDIEHNYPHLKKFIIADDNRTLKAAGRKGLLTAYMTSGQYILERGRYKGKAIYGQDLFSEVSRYAHAAGLIAQNEDFDIIHAHDWMSFGAGVHAKQKTGKPLIVHVHATEFDRTGGHPNQYVYDMERHGMHAADLIISVSNYTKNMIVNHYGIEPNKVKVVHNSVDVGYPSSGQSRLPTGDKVVLFLGRMTLQKGPDYFLAAARRVLEVIPNVTFVMAGTGDMAPQIIRRAAELGIAHKVLFTGFLSGEELSRAYQMADLYVMPSVSEPFGLTALEAMQHGTPVLISKQSGVSEVVRHCLKVDFWDIDLMAGKIIAILRHPELLNSMKQNSIKEISGLSWSKPARECLQAYNTLLASSQQKA
ncbi:glycosyltransferase family 4 protein [Candidatus Woesearchaeota archaeon]|nr:glycosyltransferase family 4 protein [Candidatus Woesearchaeota archaeon]